MFVDGCFWHGCPYHKTTRPVTNGAWWAAKLDATVARDRANDARLVSDGWVVLRCWEHESIDEAVMRVSACLAGCRAAESAASELQALKREDRMANR